MVSQTTKNNNKKKHKPKNSPNQHINLWKACLNPFHNTQNAWNMGKHFCNNKIYLPISLLHEKSKCNLIESVSFEDHVFALLCYKASSIYSSQASP